MTRSIRVAATIAVVATFAMAGCSSDETSRSSEPSTPGTSAASSTAPATAGSTAAVTTVAGSAGAAATSISIENFAFVVPEGLKAGTTVTITNKDTGDHTFTDKSGAFDVAVPANGGTVELTLPAAGTYELICHIHVSMSGTLVTSP